MSKSVGRAIAPVLIFARGWSAEDWVASDDRVRGGKSKVHIDTISLSINETTEQTNELPSLIFRVTKTSLVFMGT